MMNLRNRAALTAAIEAAERFVDVIRSLYSDLGQIDDVEPIAHTVRRRSDGLRMIEFRDKGNEDRFFDIHFAPFQKDPFPTLGKLYDFLGEDFTPEAREPDPERMVQVWLE